MNVDYAGVSSLFADRSYLDRNRAYGERRNIRRTTKDAAEIPLPSDLDPDFDDPGADLMDMAILDDIVSSVRARSSSVLPPVISDLEEEKKEDLMAIPEPTIIEERKTALVEEEKKDSELKISAKVISTVKKDDEESDIESGDSGRDIDMETVIDETEE